MVLRALQWLKHHNKYYNSIDNRPLSQLPTDGDLTGLNTMEDITTDDEVEKPADDQEPHDIATFVPAAARKMTEQEVSIVDDRRPTTVPWPSKGDAPINKLIHVMCLPNTATRCEVSDPSFLTRRMSSSVGSLGRLVANVVMSCGCSALKLSPQGSQCPVSVAVYLAWQLAFEVTQWTVSGVVEHSCGPAWQLSPQCVVVQ